MMKCRVIGFDPGSLKAGYCVLDISTHNKILEWGVWKLNPKDSLGDRLEKLFEFSSELVRKWNPQVVGIEKAVVFKNIPSSLVLSEARGILRLAVHSNLQEASKRIVELSPTLVKKSNSGHGLASKDKLRQSLGIRWGLNLASEAYAKMPSDMFDALAIATSAALVHNRSHGIKARTLLCTPSKSKRRMDIEPESSV